MAQKQQQDTPTFGFRSIQLLKTQPLGIGSYGSVCKALCDDLLCAAKIIHPTLFDPNAHQQIECQRQHRLPISRFMQECEFMSAIKHPNIVQFLGMYQDPETGLPLLLMELMDDSLTHFLESSQEAVHYHIQVNFCHDITLALSFLHSNGITHRDLSSNNVLLCGNVKAKITDFGMAKLGDINPQTIHMSFTMRPGIIVYMPPEAVKDKPVYTEKIDCFSIGVLIIQILTKCFPKPGDRHKIVHTTDPRFPTIEARVSEIERRQNHISQVDPNHPLLPIALYCLKDNDVERPSAQELCHRVAALKETPQFTESVRRARERPEPGDTTERDEKITQLEQQIKDKDEIIRQKEAFIIQAKDEPTTKNQETIAAAQQECLREQLQHITIGVPNRDNLKLNWKEGKKAPCTMTRLSNAVHSETMYFKAAGADRNIYAYNSTDETWDQLPSCKTENCCLAVVDGLLTTIGGEESDGITNQLFSLIGEGNDKKWTQKFQPMPTKRSGPIAISTGQALIVAGGIDQNDKTLKTVEVMDIATQEWSSVAALLKPLHSASVTICQGHIYIIGGWKERGDTKSVYTCTLADLFHSCKSKPQKRKRSQPNLFSSVWKKIADLPVKGSTCITFHERLLAIGGINNTHMHTPTCTSDVRIYHPTSNTWEVISQMKISRRFCFAAVLPNNKLMVVGGCTTNSFTSETDSVEIACNCY